MKNASVCRVGLRPVACLALGAGLALGAAAAMASDIEVIYTKIATHPTSIVPGATDLNGDPVVTNFRALEDLYFSPDGTAWVIKGRNQLGSELETLLLMGSGTTGNGFAQEGQPIPDGATGELFDFFGSGGGRFNELGDFAYSARARGGVASVFQKILYWDKLNGQTALVGQMGDLYVGLQDTGTQGDETMGNSVGSIHPLNDGTFGSQDSTVGNISTTRRPVTAYSRPAETLGGSFIHEGFQQTNVTVLTGITGPPSIETWKSISANTFYTTPDGTHWIAIGTVNQATTSDGVLVYDGQVVLQESVQIGATGVIVSTIVAAEILPNGDWYARGAISGGGVYFVKNGDILAKTGDPIVGGSLRGPVESWGESFLGFSANVNGDWVLTGSTDNKDLGADQVMVFNGDTVVVREGDAIMLDLDGNEVFDDAFIGRGNNTLAAFEANDLSLTPDRMVYFFASIRDAIGNDLNSNPAFGTPQAFLRIDLGGVKGCAADLDGDGVVGSGDLAILLGSWGACPGCPADLDGDGAVTSTDLATLLGSWGACK